MKLLQSRTPGLSNWIFPLNFSLFLPCNKIFEENALSLFHYNQMQKFGSTRNKIGFLYSLTLNELYVRDFFVSKFQTSVVTLKIQNYLWSSDKKHCIFCNEMSQFTYLPLLERVPRRELPPPIIKYSSLFKIADELLFASLKSPILLHWLFWNWARVDVLL